MIEVSDLNKLKICRNCKCVYMPDMVEETFSYSYEEYPRNDTHCLNCERSESGEYKKC